MSAGLVALVVALIIYQLLYMHTPVIQREMQLSNLPFSFSRVLQWKILQQGWMTSIFFWPDHLFGPSGHGTAIIFFSYSSSTPLSPLYSAMTVSENPAKLSIPPRPNTWPTTMPVSFSNIFPNSNFLSLIQKHCNLHSSAPTGFLLFPNCWLEPLNSQIQKRPQSDTSILNYLSGNS